MQYRLAWSIFMKTVIVHLKPWIWYCQGLRLWIPRLNCQRAQLEIANSFARSAECSPSIKILIWKSRLAVSTACISSELTASSRCYNFKARRWHLVYLFSWFWFSSQGVFTFKITFHSDQVNLEEKNTSFVKKWKGDGWHLGLEHLREGDWFIKFRDLGQVQ